MKSLKELQITTSDLQDLMPFIMTKVEQSLHAKTYGLQLVKENNDLRKGGKGNTLRIPLSGVVTAQKVPEGSSISLSETSFTYVEFKPEKYGVAIKITNEAIKYSLFDIIALEIDEGAKALAEKLDQSIWIAFTVAEQTTETITGAGAHSVYDLSHNKVLSIEEAVKNSDSTAVTIEAVDYYQGKVKVAEDLTGDQLKVTYYYSTLPDDYALNSSTIGQLAYVDVVKAVTSLRAENFEPDVLVAHPDSLQGILTDDRFIDASKYGSAEVLLNGEIGKFAGVNVIVSNLFFKGVTLITQKKETAMVVWGSPRESEKWEDPMTYSTILFIWDFWDAKLYRTNGVRLIFNTSTDSASL